MPIFEKFTDTIFLKEDSELQKKVDELKKIKDKVAPNMKEKYEQDLRFVEYGLKGEDRIAFELRTANIGCYVLRDINLEYNGESAQIDFVIVTRCHCYFVECKNMMGTISVNKEGEFRREYTWRGKKQKEAIYSPYRQALRHIEMFKNIWQKERGKVVSTLSNNSFDRYYKPLVIMANLKGLLNIKYAPKEIKDVTIRVDQLIDYLKKDLKEFDSKKLPLDTIANVNMEKKKDLEEFAKGVWYHHKKRFIDYTKPYLLDDEKTNYDEELRNKLIAFRTEMARTNKVPPYYVFKNDELDLIVANKPKTMAELSKYLLEVKCKKFGSRILKIINEFK